MIGTFRQVEGIPASYPLIEGLTMEAQGLDQSVFWQRIEAYTVWRFSPRSVVWTLSGEAGQQWQAPLAPVSDPVADTWINDAWEVRDLLEGPYGLILPCCGTWRITATVGAGIDVPPAVSEAFRRLAEYTAAESPGVPGASSYSINLGQVSESISRHPAHMARALENSGAADLLRPYRRL